MTTWILIRHGQTMANAQGVLAGFLETQLSEIGERQASALKEYLKETTIDYFYASSSQRAYETLKPLAGLKHAKIESVEALKEIHFGEFEGKDFSWIKAHYPDEVAKMLKEKDYYCYPKGESLVMAHDRMAKWLQEVSRTHENSVVAVCAHAGTIRSMLSQFVAGDERLHWHFKVDNASISIVSVTDGFAVIESLNDTTYLK